MTITTQPDFSAPTRRPTIPDHERYLVEVWRGGGWTTILDTPNGGEALDARDARRARGLTVRVVPLVRGEEIA